MAPPQGPLPGRERTGHTTVARPDSLREPIREAKIEPALHRACPGGWSPDLPPGPGHTPACWAPRTPPVRVPPAPPLQRPRGRSLRAHCPPIGPHASGLAHLPPATSSAPPNAHKGHSHFLKSHFHRSLRATPGDLAALNRGLSVHGGRWVRAHLAQWETCCATALQVAGLLDRPRVTSSDPTSRRLASVLRSPLN